MPSPYDLTESALLENRRIGQYDRLFSSLMVIHTGERRQEGDKVPLPSVTERCACDLISVKKEAKMA